MYIVDYKLLQKCNVFVLNKILKNKADKNDKTFEEDSLNNEELNCIIKNKEELE